MKGMDKASMVRRNKLINNMPKYDIGTTPISSGYQRATNSIPVGYVSQNGQNLYDMVSGQKAANTSQYLNSGAQLATQAIGAVNIGKDVAKGAITKGGGALLSVAGAIPSAIGLYDSINKKGEFNGLGGNELDTVASKNTEYRNGVAYQTIGGVDSDSIMRAASARDTGENVGLTMNSLGVGAGIGGAVAGPVGALVGAGLGGFLSLLGWNNSEKKSQRDRLRDWRIASNASNKQEEAIAANQGIQNEFYRTHNNTYGADQGLSPHKGKKNALVGGGEVITKHDAYGNVVDAIMEPITPYTPERADVIPIHLNENDGVLGNKINPLTGNRFAVDARYNINNPQALTQLVALQDMVTKKNRIKKYDAGKFMNILSVLPGLMEMGVGAKQSHSYAKDPVVAFNPYTINNNAAAAANELASLHYDPYPMLNSLREIDRQAIYNMNTASLSPAQRMAMLSTYYNNKMRNKADILAQGQQLENQYRGAHANLIAKLGEEDAARRLQANAAYADSFAKAQAARRKGIETGWQTGLKGIDSIVGNLLNNYWTDRNIGLWKQQINNKKESPIDIAKLPDNVLYIPLESAKGYPDSYKAYRGSWADKYTPVWGRRLS